MGDALLGLAVLLVSVIIHENAHGLTALALGDTTARDSGRLTLNPRKHLDPVGSLLLPAMLYFTAGAMFGYAKPVPVQPRRLRGTDGVGFAVVALAGPVSNLVLATLAVWLFPLGGGPVAEKTLVFFFEWNVLLAAFNLIPIPPLDGSRLIRPFLRPSARRQLDRVEPYGFLILLVLLVWLDEPFFRIIGALRTVLIDLLPI